MILPIAGNHLWDGFGQISTNMQRSLRTTVTGVLILAVLAGSGAWQCCAHAAHRAIFRQTAITRSDLYVTIAAIETLEPEEAV